MFYVVILFFFLAAGSQSLGNHCLCSRHPESGSPLSLASGVWGSIVFGNRKPVSGILNLFSGVPLHYELGDKVAAIPCWQGDNQYQVG